MTVSANYAPNVSTGNGVTTVFPYNFRILAAADLEVTVDGVVKTQGVDYTLTGIGSGSGGNVTFTVAPANGASVIRRRNMAFTRTIDYQSNGDLLAAVLNPDNDAPVMMAQQLQEQANRSLKFPLGDSAGAVLPDLATRATKGLGFDVNGSPVAFDVDAVGVAAAVAQATASAATATTQAATASTAATTATTQAGLATTARTAAETARDAAQASQRIFATAAAGDAGTTAGQYYYVVSSSSANTLELWLHNGAGGSDTGKRFPSSQAITQQAAKIGGTISFVPGAAIGNPIVTGTAAATGTLWSDGNSLPAGELQSVSLWVQTLGNGTGSIVVTRPGSPATELYVIPVTGISGTGSKTVAIASGTLVQAGDVIGWHAAAGGAQIAFGASGVSSSFVTATVTQGATYTATSGSAKLSINAVVGVMPQVVSDRLNMVETTYGYLPAGYRTTATLGDSSGDTTDAASGTIWTTGVGTSVGSYLTAIELRFSVPGTGELHLIVPDAAGGGNVVDKVFPIIVSAGLNTLTLGSAAAYAVCPTLPATMYLPRGSRIAYKRITGNGPRFATVAGTLGASVVSDTGVGSAVTFSPATNANIAIKLTTLTQTADPVAPSTRDSIVSATATVAGNNVTVSGVLNRRGTAVQFSATAALAAATTGTVTGEAHTIAFVSNQAFANNSVVDNKLANANVSAVTVKDTGVPLTLGTDYLLGAEHGIVTKVGAGTRAVTVDYTWSKRRYDLISLNPETLALVVTQGTERVRDAAEFVPTPALPALGTAIALPLFNCRVTSALVETVPVWDVFSGQRRALITELAEDRRRARSVLRKTLAKLRQAAALTICGHGDSQTAIGNGGGFATPNGVNRDIATTGFLNTGGAVGSDVIAAQTLFDFSDGGGTIHTKLGWNWTLASELTAAYGSAITYKNFGVNGEISQDGFGATWFNPVKALAADLYVVAFGMNELATTATEVYVASIAAALVAQGSEVIVVGVPRTNSEFGLLDSDWLACNRRLRRAAEATGAAFCDLTALYSDENLGALGILRKDMCQTNLYNHPGPRELGVIGRQLASLLLGE